MFGAFVRFSRTLLVAASLGLGSAGAWAYSHKTADLTGIPPTEEELYDALIPPDEGLTRGISLVARKADITVQFEFDSYLLTAEGRSVLDTLGAWGLALWGQPRGPPEALGLERGPGVAEGASF